LIGFACCFAYCEDAALRRVYDGCEALDSESAEIRNGEGASLKLLQLKLHVLCLLDQLFALFGDHTKGFGVSLFDDGSNESVLHFHSEIQVHILKESYLILFIGCV
jgi:hypothetical protein